MVPVLLHEPKWEDCLEDQSSYSRNRTNRKVSLLCTSLLGMRPQGTLTPAAFPWAAQPESQHPWRGWGSLSRQPQNPGDSPKKEPAGSVASPPPNAVRGGGRSPVGGRWPADPPGRARGRGRCLSPLYLPQSADARCSINAVMRIV